MMRQIQLTTIALSFAAALTGCIGDSEILDTAQPTETESTIDSSLGGNIIDAIAGGGAATPAERSKRDVALRLADLLIAANDPSPTEQIAWDFVSAGLADGRKGLRDSMMTLLFSPLADGFVAGMNGSD